jgi:hypothetical protein
MPVLGVVAMFTGAIMLYLGISGTTIGELMRTVFGP